VKDSIELASWQEFLAQPPSEGKPYPVYRGVANVEWGLETTLERVVD
jgi:hypothetical protein